MGYRARGSECRSVVAAGLMCVFVERLRGRKGGKDAWMQGKREEGGCEGRRK